MAITGLLSTAPNPARGPHTNSQFLDQYMREYDALEKQWLARMQPPAPMQPYVPSAFPTPPAPVAPALAPPPQSMPSYSDGGGDFPGGPMSAPDRSPGNAFGAMSLGRGPGMALGAASMMGGPLSPMASAIGFGLGMNNIAANQAMRDFYGAAPMSFGQQLGGLFGGGLLGALGLGNEAGRGISRDTAQRSYEAAIDRGMGHTFDLSLAPIGSGLAGVFGGSGYGHGPGENPAGLDMSNVGDGTQDPSGAW